MCQLSDGSAQPARPHGLDARKHYTVSQLNSAPGRAGLRGIFCQVEMDNGTIDENPLLLFIRDVTVTGSRSAWVTEAELLTKATELQREQRAKLWRTLEDLNAASQSSQNAKS